MKKIDLNLCSDVFLLWDREYKYKYSDQDREYYIKNITSLNPKNDNTPALIEIFTNILKKQNLDVNIKKEDVLGLFHYFTSVFL